MFWPIVLPFQITCYAVALAVVALTVYASSKAWSRIKTFFVYSVIGLIAFIPSCSGVMMAVDAFRLGDFSYSAYDQIPDFRSQRYMPESATDIQIRKHANGYLARYTLAADEFNLYLDGMWQQYGEDSAVERGGFSDEGQLVDVGSFDVTFGDLDITWGQPSSISM